MQSSDSSLGFRDSFAEEAEAISEQLRGHGEAEVSTIEAELPPPDLTSSVSFLTEAPSEQVQGQPGNSPLPSPAPGSEQEPAPVTPSDQDLLVLEGLPDVEEAASSVDSGRWQFNTTMELCSLASDAVVQASDSKLSTQLSEVFLPSSGTPPAEAAQPECSQAPDEQRSEEETLQEEQDLPDTSINKTFLFSRATFVTSTPHAASERARLFKETSVFSISESLQTREAPSVARADQSSARRPQRPRAAPGSPPKVTPKSGPLGKVGQEKRSQGGAPLAVSKKGHQTLPLTAQKKWSAVPFKTSGLPVLLKSRREPSAPPGARQQKGKSSEAGRAKEAEPTAKAGNNPPTKAGNNPPSAAKVSQLLRSKSVPPRFSLHQRGPSARDPKSRDPQAARSLKPLPPPQSAHSRAPSRAHEQPPKQDKKPQPSPGQTCPQCLVLQKQVEDLKSQLAAMQCLSGELQGLQGATQDPSMGNTGGTT
ncbi:uncharacterized protein [Notamacropus eugenii]|uniref:uncharacterized protein n=1 Tax=Notamacropus eugenii TaxID=9315 RepID=UPI003B67138C